MEVCDRRKIRNICILAHVDHGKTTLADQLIAGYGGGLVNPRQAGKLRYLDYLDEEQTRAITMKSSSVALRYKDHLINLIDSPGHMDFCSEVSTASRLSDGALVLVDAVEGVHIQTHAVLRQAWIEKLTPCLVLNKIDRLITELKLSPVEAYTRLMRIVNEVNGIMGTYKSEKYLSDVDSILARPGGIDEEDVLVLGEDDEEDTFQPQKGNVVFGCGLDGWGFGIKHFAESYASKLGASVSALNKALWGAKYFNSKTKMIVGKKGVAGSKNARPMFVQFVLEPLWQVYQAALDGEGDRLMLEKVIRSFNLSIPTHELQKKDPKAVLQSVLSRWLPLSDAVLEMVVDSVPDPIASQSIKIERLLPRREISSRGKKDNIVDEVEKVMKSVEVCDSSRDAPCVAFVSKMFAVPLHMIPQRGANGEVLDKLVDEFHGVGDTDVTNHGCFLAFARIFSGVLSTNQKVYVLSAMYDPFRGQSMERHAQVAEVRAIYQMMGQGLEPVVSAGAGNVVAIRGLGQFILKSATLSSTRNCWPFSSMVYQVAPTLRVAIEPSDPADMGALAKGLRLLNRADPFVEISVSSRGEQVLAAAGEVHLQRCINDLKERFARVNLEVSPPLVPYKETIEGDGISSLETLKMLSDAGDYVEKVTPNGRCIVRVRVMKLPSSITKVLDESGDLLTRILDRKVESSSRSVDKKAVDSDDEEGKFSLEDSVAMLKDRLLKSIENDIQSESKLIDKDRCEKCKTSWLQFLQSVWALGPRQTGPNICLIPDFKHEAPRGNANPKLDQAALIRGSPHVSRRLGFVDVDNGNDEDRFGRHPDVETLPLQMEARSLASSVMSGFQLATAVGPLCDEPLWGLAFLIEAYLLPSATLGGSEEPPHDQYGILAGQVMTAVKEACRAAVLQRKPRLVEAMYFCELSTPTEYLGAMYAVLSRRRAKVVKEEMQEGSGLFTAHAYVPLSESFGFADELRRWTAGASSALLLFSHWEEIPEDPFFVPKTEEEVEEFGDGSSVLPNTARKLMDAVRRRKGLPVEEKIVQHATKQRTLARKV